VALGQGVLRVRQKAINNQPLILDVSQPMLNKDKVRDIIISIIKIRQEETLQRAVFYRDIPTHANTVYHFVLGAELRPGEKLLKHSTGAE
jgi:hypothetical protein